MARCIVLIDGSNFYFKVKELGVHNLLNLDFSSFIKSLIGKDNKLIEAAYFVGRIRTDGTEKTRKLFDSQQKLISHLKKNHIRYSLGYLMKQGNAYHEKGVDVNIAVDILVAAYEDLCDRIVIVSSDTDLLPAINKARQKRKIVEYIGFSHKPSIALVARCSESRLLKKTDITKFIQP